MGASPEISWPRYSWFFYLFTQMKPTLKARGFCNATDVIRNATEELKSLSQNWFMECLQHLYRRWQNCRVAQVNYSKGNVA